MKFKFKIQQYQSDAVEAITKVFKGQPYKSSYDYSVDRGNVEKICLERTIFNMDDMQETVKYVDDDAELIGYANPSLELTNMELLSNIKEIQKSADIKESFSLYNKLGACELDVEMETGTGKTYVYIKSMFELNQKYGFNKFIIVVPSIAIREGVKKTFEMTEEHFMDSYGKKARYFIYNSKKLDEIEHFSSSDSINVMIINIQAFNARGADARRINEELDEFRSRRPIDVIAKNRPILILDEPQKMGGAATQESLRKFNPLFSMNFSATHKNQHNLIYVLDALDAFNKKLVKKIEVKGFAINHLKGTNGYLYLEKIIISPDKPPMAKIELEIQYKNAKINRETRILKVGDNLYQESKEMEQYKDGFVINDINPYNDTVTFINGATLKQGVACGNVEDLDIRRIQIRETIISHLEKEEELFNQGIKVLSLFFIDEVAKYRQYDDEGNEINGIYGEIFEEEYNHIVNDYITIFNTPYVEYLKSLDVSTIHQGYFSIDKKGRKCDSSTIRGSDISDDISAYDLILKNKERLLSFDEPTRFIFSHSALREGWDNPNVFQICTLKHSDSNVQRRQEVGRGLRLCVNSLGERMDSTIPNFDVHKLNLLTVVANDSYEEFVKGLQTEMKADLYERPTKVTKEFFIGKKIMLDGIEITISSQQASSIYKYLIKNDYIDEEDKPSEQFKIDLEKNTLADFPTDIINLQEITIKLMRSIYDDRALDAFIENGHKSKVQDNKLNDNFYKKEFQALWKFLNHKYAYYVDFDSNELIKNCIKEIEDKLFVTTLSYTLSSGAQKDKISADEITNGVSFETTKTITRNLKSNADSNIVYDLLGKIASQTSLTRKTIAEILKGISQLKFSLYKNNPEEFINKVSKMINDQKASIIVEHVTYNQIEGEFDSNIFNESKLTVDFKKAFKSTKHIRDFVFVDGDKDRGIEINLAKELDLADEVVVYAKMPRSFYIPTPVGNYSPDWAIAFKEGSVKHIYFLAETKGSLDSMQLRGIEKAKIECAEKLFNKISTSQVKYQHITKYKDLLDCMNSI